MLVVLPASCVLWVQSATLGKDLPGFVVMLVGPVRGARQYLDELPHNFRVLGDEVFIGEERQHAADAIVDHGVVEYFTRRPGLHHLLIVRRVQHAHVDQPLLERLLLVGVRNNDEVDVLVQTVAAQVFLEHIFRASAEAIDADLPTLQILHRLDGTRRIHQILHVRPLRRGLGTRGYDLDLGSARPRGQHQRCVAVGEIDTARRNRRNELRGRDLAHPLDLQSLLGKPALFVCDVHRVEPLDVRIFDDERLFGLLLGASGLALTHCQQRDDEGSCRDSSLHLYSFLLSIERAPLRPACLAPHGGPAFQVIQQLVHAQAKGRERDNGRVHLRDLEDLL